MIKSGMRLEEVRKLAHDCSCDACRHGCSYGSGILIGSDIKKLSKLLKMGEKELEEKYLESTEQFGRTFLKPKVLREGKPYGKCIFFREGVCKIHDAKPMQCRISMGCKEYGDEIMAWFVENCLVDNGSRISREQYEIYAKTGGKMLER